MKNPFIKSLTIVLIVSLITFVFLSEQCALFTPVSTTPVNKQTTSKSSVTNKKHPAPMLRSEPLSISHSSAAEPVYFIDSKPMSGVLIEIESVSKTLHRPQIDKTVK